MCRWFAYIAPPNGEACLLSDVLINPPHSLTKQVSHHYLPYLTPHSIVPIDEVTLTEGHPSSTLAPPTTAHKDPTADEKARHDLAARNLMLNTDGSGVAVYTTTQSDFSNSSQPLLPLVFKSTLPLTNDANFSSLARNTSTTCLMAHVRASSAAPVSELNCHPFTLRQWSVMHNGSIADFSRIKRPLLSTLPDGDAHDMVQGGTDSEVLAALILADVLADDTASAAGVFAAVQRAFTTVVATHRAAMGAAAGASSLNVCITDGRRLVATRFRNAADEQPPSLYWSDSAGVTLNSKYPGHPDEAVHRELEARGVRGARTAEQHGRHVIVASEPSTFVEEEWKLLPKNSALLFDEDGSVEIRELVLDV